LSAVKAYRVFQENGLTRGSVVDLDPDELSPGAVVLRAAYSSVNFKDARVATGTFRSPIRFPRVPGIDVAGTVIASSDGRYREGDAVLATGFDLGVGHDGGYAEIVRLPAEWVVPLPAGLSPFEAMTIGTAGFTAALSIIELERNGLQRANGPVLVTGASGGVGSLAVDCLAQRGYEVVAMTGKPEQRDYLLGLGAREVIPRTMPGDAVPLGEPRWAAAIDPVGGGTLAAVLRTLKYGAAVANSGLTGGADLQTTVLPFILRSVKLLGIDSVQCPMAPRLEVWRRLATDLRPAHLQHIARQVTLEDLDGVFAELLAGSATGRTVVRLSR
jgi:acrylyl-CoA reductase (NADPH)